MPLPNVLGWPGTYPISSSRHCSLLRVVLPLRTAIPPGLFINAMSLRFRLICLVSIVLLASLVVEGGAVSFNASHSVRTEMDSALLVGQQIVKSRLEQLSESSQPQRDLQPLVAAFKGNRHLRVSLTGSEASTVEPSQEESHFGMVPSWFMRLLAIPPASIRMPVIISGQDYGSILIEADPANEILEVWNDLVDGFVVLTLFFSLNILLIYFFIGRALRPLDHLAGALEQVGHGHYEMRISGKPVSEVSRLQASFNLMASELAKMDAEKRHLNEQLLNLQEEEHREIARDLHDEISPFLFAVNVDLANISRLACQGKSAEIAAQIQSTLDAVSHMQRQIRTMLNRLRPGVLADFGLVPAIMSMVEFWRRRHHGTRFKVNLPRDGVSFGALLDSTIYRIVQESLSNALRHGKPAGISVSVTEAPASDPKPGQVTVEITNDGHGIDGKRGFGFGLIGMQERVRALGGELILFHKPELGFSVTAHLPIHAAAIREHAGSSKGNYEGSHC